MNTTALLSAGGPPDPQGPDPRPLIAAQRLPSSPRHNRVELGTDRFGCHVTIDTSGVFEQVTIESAVGR